MVRIHPDPPGCELAPIAGQSRRDAPTRTRRRAAESTGREPGRATKHGEAKRGCSSVGRAPALQAGGHRFDPVQLHQQRAGGRPSLSVKPGEIASKRSRLLLVFRPVRKLFRLFFNKTEEVKRTRRSIVVCWVRLYRPDLLRVLGGWVSQTPVTQCSALWDQATKCMWWMPWRSQAMKDVAACVKPRGAGKRALIRRCPNGETRPARVTAT